MKNTKNMLFATLMILLSGVYFGTVATPTYAAENDNFVYTNPQNSSRTDIKLFNLIVTSNYDKEAIDVKIDRGDSAVTASIYEKGTENLLESYSESLPPIKELRQLQARVSGTVTYNATVEARYRVGNNKSKIYVLAYADVNISAGTGWAQINKKPTNIWQSPDSSGAWVLKNRHQSVRNTKFPTTNLELNIQGLVEISKKVSLNMGFSFEVMKGMGFNMSGTSSETWYARLNYNGIVSIKIMS